MPRLYEDPRCKLGLFRALGYEPHKGQKLFHFSDARFRVLVAGRRFGKSRCSGSEAVATFLEADPPTRTWIVAPSYDLGAFDFEYVWNAVVTKGGLRGEFERKVFNARGGDMNIKAAWGSEITVKSADHPSGLVGEELDLLVVAEAGRMKEDVWQRFLFPCLSSRQGRGVFSGTPYGSPGFARLYQKGQRRGSEWASWMLPTEMNPHFPAEEIEAAKRNLTPEMFDEQYRGRFVIFQGRVYKEFDPDVHVVEPVIIWREGKPQNLQKVIAGVDWGYTNPCVIGVVAFDGDDNALVIDEWYHREQGEEQILTAARELRDKWGITDFHCDPSEPRMIAAFQTNGLRAQPARNDVRGGIEAVRQKLRRAAGGKVGLQVSPACPNTIRELTEYMYAQTRDGALKEDRFEGDDHGVDALRYAIFSVSQPAVTARTV